MQADILDVNGPQVGPPRHYRGHGRYGRQKPAGKHVSLDKVHVSFRMLIALICDGDGLDQQLAVRFEQ